MNWDALAKPLEVLNKLVVTLAVGVGGGWAWYTFNGELKRENALAQLQKLQREIADHKRYAVESEVTAEALPRLGSEYHVKVTVVVVNRGAVDTEVPIAAKSLRITPLVTPDLPEQPRLARTTVFAPQPLMTNVEGHLVEVKSLTLPVGSQNSLHYVAQVDAPGRYMVEFSARRPVSSPPTSEVFELNASQLVDVPEIATTTGYKEERKALR
ncbi:hypothetical protein [Hydrogenophaga sp.]|jgi:hypothetical protein|uniref:hypothetical protein n=1 Tax=Hydrogenophaga sp. TaxID=1904254 RepID=UPI003F71AD98